jgi:S-(hydroxymethyl)glutathione dehydrogenase/alcohol dehydrogenase
MPLTYNAAFLHATGTPLTIESVQAADMRRTDALVRIKAAGMPHRS